MKKILVTGSLAYDHIMDFPGEFKDHILPNKVHVLNVCFSINGIQTKHGGTAGNIAYNLALLGENPTILGAVGTDFDFTRLESLGVDATFIKTFEGKTSSAHIITDQADNQITAFNAGVASELAKLDIEGDYDIAILAPSIPNAMVRWADQLREKKIPFIFDPGQQITNFSSEQLKSSCSGAILITLNDYEYELFKNKVGDPLDYTDLVLVTKGPEGSVFLTKDREIVNKPVKPNPLVDPTGAGDAVRAALIKGLLYDYKLEDIGKLASLLGTYAAEHKGTQEHSFILNELKVRYEQSFGHKPSFLDS